MRDRVSSYFAKGNDLSPAKREMVNRIARMDFMAASNEAEALILEANMIRLHRPPYNIMLKDTWMSPYIRIGAGDFPGMYFSRSWRRDGSTYIGPFPSARMARGLLRIASGIFGIRSCRTMAGIRTRPGRGKKSVVRPCLNYHLDLCSGPCAGLVTLQDYTENLELARRLLSGNMASVVIELRKRMEDAAQAERFERAAVIRDMMNALGGMEAQTAEKPVEAHEDYFRVETGETLSVRSSIGGEGGIAGTLSTRESVFAMVLHVRDGRVTGKDDVNLSSGPGRGEGLLGAILSGYYVSREVPTTVWYSAMEGLEPDDSEREEMERWLSARAGRKVRIAVPRRGRTARLGEMASRNLLLSWEMEVARARNLERRDVLKALDTLQEELGLRRTPFHIEGIDISTLHGVGTSASVVVFRNGRPSKKEYRHFAIRTVEGINDFASIAEVVERRYSRLLAEEGDMPDLILIDGGPIQLEFALGAMERAGVMDRDVIALSKGEEAVHVPDGGEGSNRILLPTDSPALQVLMMVRDESHRFALRLNRKRRSMK